MAFLQLKKAHHMDKTLNLQLLSNPLDVVAKLNDFETMEYRLKAINIGTDFKTKGEDSYAINKNQEIEFVATEALYKRISDYQKDECISITMKTEKESKAGFVWEVSPLKIDDVLKTNLIPMPDKKDDTDLAIKWGMAFNNTTRLVSSIPLHEDENTEDRVGLIAKLLPKMFEIACSMPDQTTKVKSEDDLF